MPVALWSARAGLLPKNIALNNYVGNNSEFSFGIIDLATMPIKSRD